MVLSRELIRKVQIAELRLLKILDEICRNNSIKYYLFYGSLIGAVRHHGFIPWDDDIDVVMRRCDYEKFLRIAPAQMPNDVFLQTPYTDPYTIYSFAKLRDSNTTYIEERGRNIPMHHGIWLDIFCLDKPPATIFQSLKYKFVRRIDDYALFDWQNSNDVRINYDVFHRVGVWFLKLFFPRPCDGAIHNDKLYKSITGNDICRIYVNHNTIYKNEFIQDSWLGEGLDYDFEGISVRIPNNYDACLRMMYGNYMKLPPIEDRVPRHEVSIVDLENNY